MTELDWIASETPRPMLEFVTESGDRRRLRLFAVACCWDRSHPIWTGEASPVAVKVAERFADGLATAAELHEAQTAVFRQIEFQLESGEPVWDPTYWASAPINSEGPMVHGAAFYSANRGVDLPDTADRDLRAEELGIAEGLFQARLLRCIFGNPFRPVAFDPRWRSETAVALAAGIYDARAFDRTPILADALE